MLVEVSKNYYQGKIIALKKKYVPDFRLQGHTMQANQYCFPVSLFFVPNSCKGKN